MTVRKFRALVLESKRRARSAVLRARALFRRGEDRAAESEMERAVSEDPDNAWRYDSAVDGLNARGDAAKALARLEALLKARPGLAWAHAIYGEALRQPAFNRYAEALVELERAAAAAPGCAWIRAFLGRARFHTQDRALGLADLSRAIAIRPGLGWACAWRAQARRQSGDLAGAERDLTRAVRLSPSYPMSYGWRGGLLCARRRFRRALRDLDLYLSVFPQDHRAVLSRARARRRLGDCAGSVEDLDRVARGDLNASGLMAEGLDSPERLSGLKEAVRDYSLALREASSARIRARRGEALLRLGRYGQALEDLDASLQANPRFAWAHVWRAEALCGLGRTYEAARAVERGLRLDPRYPRAYAMRGWLRRQLGDYSGAAADFGAAVRVGPLAAWCLTRQAEARIQAGDYPGAEASLSRALSLFPGYGDAITLRGEIQRRGGSPETAALQAP